MGKNVFTVDVLDAFHGDALILRHGPAGKERTVLIDGGPAGTWTQSLRPSLTQLSGGSDPVAVDLLIVSHVDDDHIHGVIDLFAAMTEAQDNESTPPARIARLWHNSFEDVAGPAHPAALAAIQRAGGGAISAAIAASAAQGKRVRDLARRLSISINEMRSPLLTERTAPVVRDGLELRVICPNGDRIQALQTKWSAIAAGGAGLSAAALAEQAAYTDESTYNLSSLVVLATCGNKRVLLTGDARGDHVLEGLERAGLMRKGGTIQVDLLKLPHHGSDRNVDPDFFERIVAKTYVVSGDGRYGNPEPKALRMLSAARGDQKYEVVLTYRDGKEELGKKLSSFFREPEGKRILDRLRVREPSKPSIRVKLL